MLLFPPAETARLNSHFFFPGRMAHTAHCRGKGSNSDGNNSTDLEDHTGTQNRLHGKEICVKIALFKSKGLFKHTKLVNV